MHSHSLLIIRYVFISNFDHNILFYHISFFPFLVLCLSRCFSGSIQTQKWARLEWNKVQIGGMIRVIRKNGSLSWGCTSKHWISDDKASTWNELSIHNYRIRMDGMNLKWHIQVTLDSINQERKKKERTKTHTHDGIWKSPNEQDEC